mmetsp:Transcript_11952/g.36801  ORF Transcript_11952/g.36801 Transcript_11952/m.36801 type:complete len:120 (-) Transcript_11952:96-455(-)
MSAVEVKRVVPPLDRPHASPCGRAMKARAFGGVTVSSGSCPTHRSASNLPPLMCPCALCCSSEALCQRQCVNMCWHALAQWRPIAAACNMLLNTTSRKNRLSRGPGDNYIEAMPVGLVF